MASDVFLGIWLPVKPWDLLFLRNQTQIYARSLITMKWTVPLLSIISVLWILGGSYYMAQSNCGSEVSANIPALTILDGEYNFETSSEQHFSFSTSSSQLRIEDQAGRALGDVARHLSRNEQRKLNLSGSYLASENNPTDYANLGIARAEAIKSFLVAIDKQLVDRIQTTGVLKASVYTFGGHQVDGVSFDFSTYQAPTEPAIEDVDPEAVISQAVEEEPTKAIVNTPRYVVYGREDILSMEMDITLQQQIDNMRSALDLNPGAEIIVTGHSQAKDNASSNKKLALSWADTVRRFFRNNGIRSKEITAYTKGDTEPLVPVDHPDAIDKNNRVVVEVRLEE